MDAIARAQRLYHAVNSNERPPLPMVACLFAHNVEWVVHRESHDTTDYQDVQKKREREEDENNNK